MTLENKLTRSGEHYSVYIARWVNCGGDFDGNLYRYARGAEDESLFTKWLRSMDLTDDQIDEIVQLVTIGKCEFEMNAREFIKENKKPEYSKWYLFKNRRV